MFGVARFGAGLFAGTGSPQPSAPDALTGVTAVAAGWHHSLALLGNGAARSPTASPSPELVADRHLLRQAVGPREQDPRPAARWPDHHPPASAGYPRPAGASQSSNGPAGTMRLGLSWGWVMK